MWSLCPILTEYSSYIMKSNETTKYFILMMFVDNVRILFSTPLVLVSLTLLSNGSNSVPVALIHPHPLDKCFRDPNIDNIELVVINLNQHIALWESVILCNLDLQFPLYTLPLPINPPLLKSPIVRNLRPWHRNIKQCKRNQRNMIR